MSIEMLSAYPSMSSVVSSVLEAWPEHLAYCTARFRDNDPGFLDRTEEFATLVVKSTGDDLPGYCKDYRWMCEAFLNEEVFFRRHGHYRLSTFGEANAEIYSNHAYMSRYVRGILISQIIWDPHARAFDLFRTEFLGKMPADAHYVEVGPGHGFFLYFASICPQIASLEGWDVSDSSIRETRAALGKLGVTRDIEIVHQDILEAPSRHNEFDAAVISEVLEHLERPDQALRTLHSALKPGGRIFINAPINSPAPDHIYLWTETDEFTQFVEAQGFRIDSAHFLPVTGVSLERAVKKKLSVSCIVIATKI